MSTAQNQVLLSLLTFAQAAPYLRENLSYSMETCYIVLRHRIEANGMVRNYDIQADEKGGDEDIADDIHRMVREIDEHRKAFRLEAYANKTFMEDPR